MGERGAKKSLETTKSRTGGLEIIGVRAWQHKKRAISIKQEEGRSRDLSKGGISSKKQTKS